VSGHWPESLHSALARTYSLVERGEAPRVAALSPLIIPRIFGSAFEASVHVAQVIGKGASVNYALQSTDGRLLGGGG